VKYEVTGEPLVMYNCYCEICRTASGASYATNVVFPATRFKIVEGASQLAAHESSPGKKRHFCDRCGSPIFSHGETTKEVVSVRSGTLTDDPQMKPSFHAYVASKAPWVDLPQDGLPQYPGAPPPQNHLQQK
jgi:hypothetical protein